MTDTVPPKALAPSAAAIDLNPGFRGLTTRLREFRRLIAASVGHLGFDISMMESSRDGALQFVVLFYPVAAGAQENDVRMVFTSFGPEEVSITIRDPRGGASLGLHKLAHLNGARLRKALDLAIAKAAERVTSLAAARARSQHWQYRSASSH